MVASGNSLKTAASPSHLERRNSEPFKLQSFCGDHTKKDDITKGSHEKRTCTFARVDSSMNTGGFSLALMWEMWMNRSTPHSLAIRANLAAPVTWTSRNEKFFVGHSLPTKLIATFE